MLWATRRPGCDWGTVKSSVYCLCMTDSSLIVFLPLVGAILGAVVGAFGGAYANSRFRDRETKKVEDEERRSLLFLIETEVGFNAMYLEAVSKGPPSGVIPYLRTDVWDTGQTRLAHLLPISNMKKLVPYYEQTRIIKRSEAATKDEPDQLSDTEWNLIRETQNWGFAVSHMVQQYLQDPEYRSPADIIARDRRESG